MPQEDPTPKLQIDSDWKAEAQAEKERLTAEEKTREEADPGPGAAGGQRELPEASFKTLTGMLASQAIMGLGAIQDPDTKGVVIDLDGAHFSIELLAVLDEKTKGNLSDEESSELRTILTELRGRYVQVTNLIAQQAAAGIEPGVAGGPVVPPPG